MTWFRKYGLYFLFWTAFGLFAFTQNYSEMIIANFRVRWQQALGMWLAGSYVLALAVPAVLWLGCRFPFARNNWLRPLVLHLPASILWSAATLAVAAVVLPYLHLLPEFVPAGFARLFTYLLVTGLQANFFLYWEVLAVQSALRYYRDTRKRELHTAELKVQLAQAQLSALKAQLQPHFLFNTLNAITVLVRQHRGRQAEEVLVRFSDLLRCVLEDVNAHEVPLQRELEYVRLYLAVEEVRFQDRLRVDFAIDPSVLDSAVPQMSLQPILENAIRHGIGRRSTAGKIHITAGRAATSVEIKVEDDGPGFQHKSPHEVRGIGLSNTRARLEQLYGEAGQLHCENGAKGGAVVTVRIPYHLAPDPAGG